MRLKLLFFAFFFITAPLLAMAMGSVDKAVAFKPVSSLNIADIALQVDGGKSQLLEGGTASFYVVNLWASWCPPCVAELPSLQALQNTLEQRSEAIEVKVISVDRVRKDFSAKDFLKEHGITNLTPYHDRDKQLYKRLKPSSMPMTYLVNKQGDVIAVYDRPAQWDAPHNVDAILDWKNKQSQ